MTPLRARLRGYQRAIACRFGCHEEVLVAQGGVLRQICLHCQSPTPGWDTLEVKAPRRRLRGTRARVLHNPRLAAIGLTCRCAACLLDRWRQRAEKRARRATRRRRRILALGARPCVDIENKTSGPLGSEPSRVADVAGHRAPLTIVDEHRTRIRRIS